MNTQSNNTNTTETSTTITNGHGLPETRGSKYNKTLYTKDIAPLIREDIKKATKEGKIAKGVKVSVRTKYFSGGSSIDVSITAVPVGWDILTRKHVEQSMSHNHIEHWDRAPRYTTEVQATLDTVKDIVNAYHRDGSDTMTDYFDVNFYKHIDVDWQIENASYKAHKAAIEAANATPAAVVTTNVPVALPVVEEAPMAEVIIFPTPKVVEPAIETVEAEVAAFVVEAIESQTDADVAEQKERALKDMLSEKDALIAKQRAMIERLVMLANAKGLQHSILAEAANLLLDTEA